MSAALKETPSHLLGNGRPVAEEITLTDLKVTGAIPRELDGRYVRAGANPLSGTSAHPFFWRWHAARRAVARRRSAVVSQSICTDAIYY